MSINLDKGEIMRPHNRFKEIIHELNSKMNLARNKVLEITSANNPSPVMYPLCLCKGQRTHVR